MERALLVMLGGGIGALLRYAMSLGAARWLGTEFPYGTLLVNVSGAFAVGLVHELATEPLMVPDNLRLFLATGMLGGFTTYSAFSYESARLMESGLWSQAWINIVLTTVICLGVCFLGMGVGRMIVAPRA